MAMARADGRDELQLRALGCETALLHRADGSAKYWQGNTCVLVSVNGPMEVPMRQEKSDRATIQVIFKPKVCIIEWVGFMTKRGALGILYIYMREVGEGGGGRRILILVRLSSYSFHNRQGWLANNQGEENGKSDSPCCFACDFGNFASPLSHQYYYSDGLR